MIDNATLIQILQSRLACRPAIDWLEQRNSDEMWEQCERPDWLLWWAAPYVPRTQLVWVACQCARLALPHVTAGDIRPLKAIETAEAWTRGEATLEEVESAAGAAYDAYDDADAAYDAAAAELDDLTEQVKRLKQEQIETDGTDFAHREWWRGYDDAFNHTCLDLQEMLDGKDNGVGTCNEPWETLRRRVLALRQDALAEQVRVMREALEAVKSRWSKWPPLTESTAHSVHLGEIIATTESALALTPTAAELQAKANAEKAAAWDATMADFKTGEMSTSLVHERMMARDYALRAAREASDESK
ncbi:hypothetical protein UFOVP398_54 [uncultured Caudovirales phage]|uniref:Uncharacterized protein n=1 Tax=uncultured Caudovirales phage TaxID=2100421 RepID=A0A6J5M627_9CAUD|nr:hypothetical protein UFOVP398_54 [uncultured Caudovirales phage]